MRSYRYRVAPAAPSEHADPSLNPGGVDLLFVVAREEDDIAVLALDGEGAALDEPQARTLAAWLTTAVNGALRAYLRAGLWSTNADHLDPKGTGSGGAMEDHFSVDDLPDETVAQARRDVEGFIVANLGDIRALDCERVGHDFWLTRNEHGAGFWDRGLGERGDRLTAAAEAYGSTDLYVGDDGKVYLQ